MSFRILLPSLLCLCLIASSSQAETTVSKKLPYISGSLDPVVINFNDMPWQTNPDGSQTVYLYGHPSKPGLFILLSKDVPGYKKAPHYHNKLVFVTLLEGSFYVGYGNRFDKSKAIPIKANNLTVNPPGVVHYEWTETGAISQVIGIGPWDTIYVDDQGKAITKK